jgi:hypothetical protein
MTKETDLQKVYIDQMIEVCNRLNASYEYIERFFKNSNYIEFDCAVLQFRKALEATAYASISPNKEEYRALRLKAKGGQDFSKDFKATAIFQNLEEINKDFYPVPLTPAIRQDDASWKFGRKENAFLTKKKFSRTYDRLGKFLHADNPWDKDKQRQNIAKDIKSTIPLLRNLLQLHAVFIRTQRYNGVWVVEVPEQGSLKPNIFTAISQGDFSVQ